MCTFGLTLENIMQEPITVFVEVRNGVPVEALTSLATEGGIVLRIIQTDDDDAPEDKAEAEQIIAEMCEKCPYFLNWN